MRSSPGTERRTARAQVWLGTLVEIALPAREATDARFAAAFAAVAHVHRKMSAHDSASDLARICRGAHLAPVTVDGHTYAVLEIARTLHEATDGAFDVAIAPVLARAGLLPARAAPHARGAGMDAIRLLPGRRVQAAAPLALDLGGIAKGYGVDLAVAALQATGVRSGVVNAGGDLRAFGANDWLPVNVRHPVDPTRIVPLLELCDAAVATSADYFGDARGCLVDPRDGRLRQFTGSVTVVAPTCALADTLTKAVALAPAKSHALLARYGAHAFRLDSRDGRLVAATTCPTATAHVRLLPEKAA